MKERAPEAHEDHSTQQASSSPPSPLLLVAKPPPTNAAAAAATATTTTTAMRDGAPTTGKSSSIPKNKQAKTASTSTATATTTTTATTVADQIVKDLGQKTRSRFVQERNKRPEIKRLETAPIIPATAIAAGTTTKITITAKAGAKSGTVVLAGKGNQQAPPRKSSSTSKKRRAPTAQQQVQQNVDEIVDYWCPDVSQLQQHVPSSTTTKKEEDRSNCVRLHGLPLHTTTAHIQSFFRGLNPQRIVLLPSLNQHVPTWDIVARAPAAPPPAIRATPTATTSPPKKKRPGQGERHYRLPQQPIVERYPFHFRVLVKFQSAPTATLAVDRSGELLTMTTTTTTIDDNGNNSSGRGGLKKVAISVTPVRKSEASYLLRHLAIDADSSSSSSSSNTSASSLETTLARIEQALGKDVTFMLWSAAKHHLQLTSVDLSSLTASSLFISTTRTSATNLTSLLFCKNLHRIKSREVLAKQRNQLLELYQRLLLLSPASGADHEDESSCCSMLDPELLALDPILRLTMNAAKCVMEQVKRMDERLLIMTRVQQKQFSAFHTLPLFRPKRRPDEQQQAQPEKDSRNT